MPDDVEERAGDQKSELAVLKQTSLLAGSVKLTGDEPFEGDQGDGRADSGRSGAPVCEFTPRLKAYVQGGAVLGRGQEMATDSEVIADTAEGGEEALSRVRRLKALHSPLAQPCGLVALLHPVVQARMGADPQMLHSIQLSYALLGCAVARKAIGHDSLGRLSRRVE